MWIALGGAFLTAAYTVRATYLTFFGEPRGAAAVGEEHHVSGLGAALSAHDAPHDVQQEGELERERHAGASPSARGGRRPTATTAAVTTTTATRRPPAARVAEADPDPHLHPRRPRRASPGSPTPRRSASSGRTSRSTSSPARRSSPESGAADRGRRGRRATAGDEGEGTGAAEEAEEHAAAGCGYDDARGAAICYFPAVDHAEFKWSKAALSLIVVAAGLVSSWFLCVALYTRRRPPARRAHRALRARPAGGYALPGQQVLPGRPLREGHRPGHRPPDRQRGELGQPARHRRRRQRRRQGRARPPAACSTATSTRRSSTEPSTAPARSPTRPAPRCNPCSPARSASTAVCSSAPPPWAPSCS